MGALGSSGGSSAGPSSGAGAGGSAASPSPSLLLSIPAAELRQVSGEQQQLLECGPLTLSVADKAPAVRSPQLPAPPQPAPPMHPPGKQGLYPEVYHPPSDSGSHTESDGAMGTSIVAAVGPRTWEILPESQTLKVGELTFVFSTARRDVFFTVTLASNTDEQAVGMLEAILESVSIYKESAALLGDAEVAAGDAALAEDAYKSSLAKGVHKTSRMLASGLLASATYASNAISKSAASLTPEQPTANPVTISPGLKKRFQQGERLAGSAASLVNSAVSGLAWAGAKVAGGVLTMVGANKPLKPGEDAGTLREVSRAAIIGFAEVWDSMEDAGRLVLLSARDNTASVVRQRYGEDASQVSTHGLNAAGYSAEAAFAARKLGVKTVAKAAAKKTAKGVIHKWSGMPAAGAAGAAGAADAAGAGGSKPGTGSKPGSAGNLAGGAAAGTGGGKPAAL